MQEQITYRSNIIDDIFNEGQTIALNGSIYDDKKRKLYLVA